MRILITNDDGINAEGIRALAEWALTISDDVTVIAPKVEQSGKSHSIDFTHPLEIKRVDFLKGVRAYTVDSTPLTVFALAYAVLRKDMTSFSQVSTVV